MTLADQAADEAIERVSRSLTDDEKRDALIAVGETASHMEQFTTDDVPFRFPLDVDFRAAGYVMRAAAREGFITPSSLHRKSESVTCHARPKRLWISLIR